MCPTINYQLYQYKLICIALVDFYGYTPTVGPYRAPLCCIYSTNSVNIYAESEHDFTIQTPDLPGSSQSILF